VDRFASTHNAQITQFNSRFWIPGSEAIDTLPVTGVGRIIWWFPPVCLVPRVLRHEQNTKAFGTLTVP